MAQLQTQSAPPLPQPQQQQLQQSKTARAAYALKSGVVYGGSALLSGVNAITPHFSGAVDVMIVEQPDGSYKSTPFYVRFGKYTHLRAKDRKVSIYVNGKLAPFSMHLGEYGQAYFTCEGPADVQTGVEDDDEQQSMLAGMMSPASGYSSGDDESRAPHYANQDILASVQEDLARFQQEQQQQQALEAGGASGGVLPCAGSTQALSRQPSGVPNSRGRGVQLRGSSPGASSCSTSVAASPDDRAPAVAAASPAQRSGSSASSRRKWRTPPPPPAALGMAAANGSLANGVLLGTSPSDSGASAASPQPPAATAAQPRAVNGTASPFRKGAPASEPGHGQSPLLLEPAGEAVGMLQGQPPVPVQVLGFPENPQQGSEQVDSPDAGPAAAAAAAAAGTLPPQGGLAQELQQGQRHLGAATPAGSSAVAREVQACRGCEGGPGGQGMDASAPAISCAAPSSPPHTPATSLLSLSIRNSVGGLASQAQDTAGAGQGAAAPRSSCESARSSSSSSSSNGSRDDASEQPVQDTRSSESDAHGEAAPSPAGEDAVAAAVEPTASSSVSLPPPAVAPLAAAPVSPPPFRTASAAALLEAAGAADHAAAPAAAAGPVTVDLTAQSSPLPKMPNGLDTGSSSRHGLGMLPVAQAMQGLELSLCGAHLSASNTYAEAVQLFEAYRVGPADWAERAGELVQSPHLMVRLQGEVVPWSAAAPMILGWAAFGHWWPHLLPPDTLRWVPPCGITPVSSVSMPLASAAAQQQEETKKGQSSSWRLWPFRRGGAASAAAAGGITPPMGSSPTPSLQVAPLPSAPALLATASSSNTLAAAAAGAGMPHSKSMNVSLARSDSISTLDQAGKSPSARELGSTPSITRKTLLPSAAQLRQLELREGQNTIKFVAGSRAELVAYVYFYHWATKLVVSDVDGTITKSDVLGHLLPAMGWDWSHAGISRLFTDIAANNYQLMYLSSRSISQAGITRDYLNSLVQGQHRMPEGPVIISPHGLLPSLYREMILRRPHEFKIATLQDIRALFPADWCPFYAGFGNRDTDEISYRTVGVPEGRIFIINPKGELRKAGVAMQSSTLSTLSAINELVHDIFPPIVRISPLSAVPLPSRSSSTTLALPAPPAAAGDAQLAAEAVVAVAGAEQLNAQENAAGTDAGTGAAEVGSTPNSITDAGPTMPGMAKAGAAGQAGSDVAAAAATAAAAHTALAEQQAAVTAAATAAASAQLQQALLNALQATGDYGDLRFWNQDPSALMAGDLEELERLMFTGSTQQQQQQQQVAAGPEERGAGPAASSGGPPGPASTVAVALTAPPGGQRGGMAGREGSSSGGMGPVDSFGSALSELMAEVVEEGVQPSRRSLDFIATYNPY